MQTIYPTKDVGFSTSRQRTRSNLNFSAEAARTLVPLGRGETKDDWAFRKGRNYGTIIVDHELGKPIDLRPSSAGNDVKKWLEKRPSIEVVTRDRSGEYRQATQHEQRRPWHGIIVAFTCRPSASWYRMTVRPSLLAKVVGK